MTHFRTTTGGRLPTSQHHGTLPVMASNPNPGSSSTPPMPISMPLSCPPSSITQPHLLSTVHVPNLTELSRVTGIGLSHLSRVWAGERGISITGLRLIADAMGISLDELCLMLDSIKAGAERVMTGSQAQSMR